MNWIFRWFKRQEFMKKYGFHSYSKEYACFACKRFGVYFMKFSDDWDCPRWAEYYCPICEAVTRHQYDPDSDGEPEGHEYFRRYEYIQ